MTILPLLMQAQPVIFLHLRRMQLLAGIFLLCRLMLMQASLHFWVLSQVFLKDGGDDGLFTSVQL